jgi:hypothetical protein
MMKHVRGRRDSRFRSKNGEVFTNQIHCKRVYRPLQFNERSQLFIRTHDEPLTVAAMCVCNPDRSPVGINR